MYTTNANFGWIIACLVLLLQGAIANTVLDNLAFIQVNIHCDGVEKIEVPFVGGDDYFNARFEQLKRDTEALSTKFLDELTITKRATAPEDQVYEGNKAFMDKDVEKRIKVVNITLGVGRDLIFCFKNGLFLDCTNNKILTDLFAQPTPYWTYTFSCNDGWRAGLVLPRIKTQANGEITKIVMSVEVNISNIDINQCKDSTDLSFRNTARCPSAVSKCTHIGGAGFAAGSYSCECTQCTKCLPVSGKDLLPTGFDEEVNATALVTDRCTLKEEKSAAKDGEGECYLLCGENSILYFALLGVQGLCVLMCLIFAVVVIIFKSSQAICVSKCLVLELILFGAIVLYSTLVLKILEPNDIICLLQPWLYEVGFICMYGAVILKTYKSLAEFQTRKARRVHIRDKDLLKYWLVCLALVIVYVASWTAINIDYVSKQNISLVFNNHPSLIVDGKQCIATGWNYVTQIAELLFVAFGLYMSYRLRSAPSMLWESRYYAAALGVEFVCSLAYYVLCDILVSSPHWMFIVSFIHLQITVTVVLILIFGPKFYYIKHNTSTSAFRTHSRGNTTDLVDFRTHGKSGDNNTNGEIDLGDINIAEMDPDDIKKELRRVYEQLQMLKVKVMRYENPHLSAKKGHSKSRLPFYKQISKHGSKKNTRDNSLDAEAIDEPELEPLNRPPAKESSHTKPSNQTSF